MLEFFLKEKEVFAFVTEKREGSMKRTGKKGSATSKNRERFLKEKGISAKKAVAAELVHGNRIGIIKNGGMRVYPGVDGLVTDLGRVCLLVTVADCAPVFFWEPRRKLVGICHAGWRGIAGGVVLEALRKMETLGGLAEKMKVAVGPMIGSCCFEVKKEVADLFLDLGLRENVKKRKGKIFIDLGGAIKRQLLESGIKAKNIEICSQCTYCKEEKYFSYRRDKGCLGGVMLAGIVLGDKK